MIGTQIKELRKALDITQSEFAEVINLSRNYIAVVEIGQREPSERTIADICEKFNVREEWLRTGQGDIFQPVGRGEEIGQIVRSAAQTDPEEAVSFFKALLEGMSDAEILLMYEVFKRHFPNKKDEE